MMKERGQRSPSGPTTPWDDEDAYDWMDRDEGVDYAQRLALEHARAILTCRLEDRLSWLRSGDLNTITAELHRQMVELAAEGRLPELQDLIAQVSDLRGA